MLALSLFGTVAGLEVRTFGQLPTALPDEWIALNSGDLRLQDDQGVLAVSRRKTTAGILTWIGLYRPAIEMTSDRGGGCVGAGVWVLGKVVPASPVMELLAALTDQLTTLAMSGGRFTRRISTVESAIDWREDIGRRMRNLTDLPLNGGLGGGDLPRAFFDASSSNSSFPLSWVIDSAQMRGGLSNFRALFVSTSRDVAESARRSGRLQILTVDTLLAAQVSAQQRAYEDLAQAQEKLQIAESHLADESAARSTLDRQLAELGSAHARALKEIGALDTTRHDLTEELERRRSETETLRLNWQQAERDIQTREQGLKQEAARLDDRQRQLQFASVQLDDKVKAREEELHRQNAALDKKSRQLADEHRELSERERQVKKDAAQLVESQIRLKNADNRVRALENQLQDQRALEKQAQEQRHARADIARQLETTQKRLTGMERDRDRITAELNSRGRQTEHPRPAPQPGALIPVPSGYRPIDNGDAVFQDRSRENRPPAPRLLNFLWPAPLWLGCALLLALMLSLFKSDLLKRDSSAQATGTCDAGWSSANAFSIARIHLVGDSSLQYESVVKAMWGLACGEKRTASCFSSDVDHMMRRLQPYTEQIGPSYSSTGLTIGLPASCQMPVSMPLTLGLGQLVPYTPYVNREHDTTDTRDDPVVPTAEVTQNGSENTPKKVPKAKPPRRNTTTASNSNK